mmetsp:Transcript_79000/g.139538  ORF Transcript_79000/g.139538 Transcript_79000/m.139538 type:complete len:234 (+) Transcript_79000:1723-2424(+)
MLFRSFHHLLQVTAQQLPKGPVFGVLRQPGNLNRSRFPPRGCVQRLQWTFCAPQVVLQVRVKRPVDHALRRTLRLTHGGGGDLMDVVHDSLKGFHRICLVTQRKVLRFHTTQQISNRLGVQHLLLTAFPVILEHPLQGADNAASLVCAVVTALSWVRSNVISATLARADGGRPPLANLVKGTAECWQMPQTLNDNVQETIVVPDWIGDSHGPESILSICGSSLGGSRFHAIAV